MIDNSVRNPGQKLVYCFVNNNGKNQNESVENSEEYGGHTLRLIAVKFEITAYPREIVGQKITLNLVLV